MVLAMEAVYADGWDDGVVNPLSCAAARDRHLAGLPYSVVLTVDGRLHAVMDLAVQDRYCAVTRFDTSGRRASRHEFRQAADGDLVLRQASTWAAPPEVGEHEYPLVAAWQETTYRSGGIRIDFEKPQGDRGSCYQSTSQEAAPRLRMPAFGRWEALLALAGDSHATVTEATGSLLPTCTAFAPPWRPPRPLAPQGIEDLFRPGAERRVGDRSLQLSSQPAGSLHLPTGRLVAADPSALDHGVRPFAVTLPPGTYPAILSIATFTDDPAHRRVAAARLDVTARPTSSWELALRDGDDPDELGDGEFFGFGVDAGVACVVDDSARGRLADAWREVCPLGEPQFAAVGADEMIVWSSGWGDGCYPTWIGRDQDGAVTCFIADMLLFDDEPDQLG